MKSPKAKERWRGFIKQFDKLNDFDFGTLIRIDASKEFSPDNVLLVVRLEFWAIEIARNREGCNDGLRKKYKLHEVPESNVEEETS